MSIEKSKQYLINETQWIIDESTFHVIDEERAMWVARVTTTHLTERGEKERSFTVLVRYTEHFTLYDAHLPILLDWCLKHAK